MNFDFEYFSSANVVLYLDDFPLLEAAAFSVHGAETKRPLYGYASRFFDAVARGQVIFQGSMVINYVHQDYLFRAASLAANKLGIKAIPNTPYSPVQNVQEAEALYQVIQENGVESSDDLIAQLQSYYWDQAGMSPAEETTIWDTYNMHDRLGGFNIKVVFGPQGANRPAGDTGFLLDAVHFTGRGQDIEISPNVIVESYSFLARNMYSVKNAHQQFRIPSSSSGSSQPILK